MFIQIYIKKLLFFILSIFVLTSCGLIGGDENVEVSENAVLSGPPLVIPPEFDVESQNSIQQSQEIPNYDLETQDIGNLSNEDLFVNEIEETAILDNSDSVQSFENFNQTNLNNNNIKNIEPRVQKTYRSSVPSDAYDVGRDLTKRKQKKKLARKSENDFVGFGSDNFENIQDANKDLSQEEEFLLEDILNTKDTQNDIQDFSVKGDSD